MLDSGIKSLSPDTLAHPDQFVRRHIGPNATETAAMLKLLGFDSLDALTDAAVPKQIRLGKPLNLPAAQSEFDALRDLKSIAAQNQVFRSFIGMGYYDCITPPVIQRNMLENPGWYTQYTPYQAEISQGRLEALLNFQTMVIDLTALDIANASHARRSHRRRRSHDDVPSARRTGATRSSSRKPAIRKPSKSSAAARQALGIEVVVGNHETFEFTDQVFGALVQYPDTFGAIHDFEPFTEKAHAAGALVTVAADLLASRCIKPPGEFGADIAVGSAQRFGVPLGYGGPHAAFFATRDEFKRQMPGRIVGVSKDSRGKPALRLALGTREQHIRREKATSNICTAQALLANMASLYACYHGPEGLKQIAQRVHTLTAVLAAGLEKARICCQSPIHDPAASTRLRIALGDKHAADILKFAEAHRMNLRVIDDQTIGISLDETTSASDVAELWQVFNGDKLPISRWRTWPITPRAMRKHRLRPHSAFLAAPRLQPLPLRDRDAPLHQAARIARPLAHGFHDSARLVHDEAQRGGGDVSRHVAGVRQDSSVRADQTDARLPETVPATRNLARGNHRVRRHFAPAQRRFAGRIRRAARHPRLSRIARRGAPQRLPDPHLRARHEPRQRRHGRHESRRRRLRHQRQH